MLRRRAKEAELMRCRISHLWILRAQGNFSMFFDTDVLQLTRVPTTTRFEDEMNIYRDTFTGCMQWSTFCRSRWENGM